MKSPLKEIEEIENRTKQKQSIPLGTFKAGLVAPQGLLREAIESTQSLVYWRGAPPPNNLGTGSMKLCENGRSLLSEVTQMRRWGAPELRGDSSLFFC